MRPAKITIAAERHMKALALARECVQLGARSRTIELLTGLSASRIASHFHGHPSPSQRGRPPDSREWYYKTTLPNRAQACMLVSIYHRLCQLGIDPAQALVRGYAHYAAACKGEHRLKFDRAFDLVAHFDGRWIVAQRSFALADCPICGSQVLTGPQSDAAIRIAGKECPFCRLIERFRRDPRIEDSFPVVPVAEPPVIQFPSAVVLRALG